MYLIDMHAHIYPDKVAEKAVEAVGNFYVLEMHNSNGSVDSLLKVAKDSPIEVKSFLVHSVAVTPKSVTSINDFLAEECKKHAEFRGFGTLHAEMEEPEKEINRMIELGLKGVKIHPDSQKFDIDSKKMFEIYEILQSKKMPVLAHCGDYRYDYTHPRRTKRVLNNFKSLEFIGAHFGGWSIWDLALEYMKDERIFMDCSSSLQWLGKVRSKELIRLYGAERILFGSDFPMWTHKEEIEFLQSLNLTDNEYELIFYKNAKKILDFN